MSTTKTREPAVAGSFYPGDPRTLRAAIEEYTRAVPPVEPQAGPVRAVIAPHAGYIYSGPIAAYSFQALGRDAAPRRTPRIGGSAHEQAQQAQAEFETVQARVGALDEGEVGLDEHHDRSVAALRLAQNVVRGAYASRTPSAKAAQPAVDQPRVNFLELPVADAPAVKGAGAIVLDEHIGLRHQLLHQVLSFRPVEVNGTEVFVGIGAQKAQAGACRLSSPRRKSSRPPGHGTRPWSGMERFNTTSNSAADTFTRSASGRC